MTVNITTLPLYRYPKSAEWLASIYAQTRVQGGSSCTNVGGFCHSGFTSVSWLSQMRVTVQKMLKSLPVFGRGVDTMLCCIFPFFWLSECYCGFSLPCWPVFAGLMMLWKGFFPWSWQVMYVSLNAPPTNFYSLPDSVTCVISDSWVIYSDSNVILAPDVLYCGMQFTLFKYSL